MEKIVIYPGTFDPLTLGHIDLIQRAATLFDRVIVAIAQSALKAPVLSLEKRLAVVKASLKDLPQVQITTFSGLAVDFMRQHNIRVLLRGIRTVSDMEYEFQLATMNQRMFPQMETVFLKPDERFAHISSSIIREIASMGGDLTPFIPEAAILALKK